MFGLCTCCKKPCVIFHDPFDGYSDELGDSWCEDPAQWRKDESCAISQTPGATAICNAKNEPHTSMVVAIRTKDEIDQSNQVYRVMVNIEKDAPQDVLCTSENFYFAEFVRKGANDSILRLGVCSNGVEIILKQDTIFGLTGFSRVFRVFIAPNEFCGVVTNATLSLVSTAPAALFPEGYHAGMMLSHEEMKVDDFWHEQHFFTNKECGFCLCKCKDTYIPPVLNARIYPDPLLCDRLDLLSGCSVRLEWNRINSVWQGEAMCCNNQQLWRLKLTCPTYYGQVDGDPCTMVLSVEVGCLASCGPGCIGPQFPVECDCGPLRLRYGPYLVTQFDFTCPCSTETNPFNRGSCNYYIDVTL